MRRLYYIYPKMQFPFTCFMTGLVAVELIVLGFVLFITEGLSLYLPNDLAIYLRYGSMLVLILACSTVNMFLGARMSHRVAGPLVQILRALEKARRGDYHVRVQVRANDYLHDISDALNLLLESLDNSEKNNQKLQKNGDKQCYSNYSQNISQKEINTDKNETTNPGNIVSIAGNVANLPSLPTSKEIDK